jgi:hypothetical protein
MEQAGEAPPAISSSSSLFESGRRALNLKLLRCGLLFLQGESPSCHPLTRQLNLPAGGRLSFPLRPQNAMITQFDQIKRPAKVHNKHRPPASLSLFTRNTRRMEQIQFPPIKAVPRFDLWRSFARFPYSISCASFTVSLRF